MKLLIFDLDGTLIDSSLDLAHAVNFVLNSLGKENLPIETIISFVGDGAAELLNRSLMAVGISKAETEKILPDMLTRFLDRYLEHCLDCTTFYPHALAMLDRFSNCTQAILTNKPMAHTEKILHGLGIWDRFKVIVPGDGPLGKKPDPAGLGYILSSMKVAASEALLIGDSMQDLQTAQAAGCNFIAYLNGFGNRKELEAGSSFSMQAWNEFPDVMKRMEQT